jgi:hypothetical protein
MATPNIVRQPKYALRNWHLTDGVGGDVQQLCTPRNEYTDAPTPEDQWFKPGLEGLQQLVREAEAQNGANIRAFGARWSTSQVFFSPDFVVDTNQLSGSEIGCRAEWVVAARQAQRKHLVFAQCGEAIASLNSDLQDDHLALITSGASNGQTVAGAISTGTHGSAHLVGGMPDTVRAIHVVGAGGQHWIIQRDSDRWVTQAFADWLGATLLDDDDVFAAALVGFGACGLVHGYLIEVEDLYTLRWVIQRRTTDEVSALLVSRDISKLGIAPQAGETLHHVEFVFNPYMPGAQQGGFVRVMFKKPHVQGTPIPQVPMPGSGTFNAPDAVSIASLVSTVLPAIIPGEMQSMLLDAFKPTDGVTGTRAQVFGDVTPTNGGTTSELMIDAARAGDAFKVLQQVAAGWTFGTPFAFRFVKGSSLLLAPTADSLGATVCTIEMPGINADRTRTGHQRVWDAMAASGIPHTFHWGQSLPMEASWMKAPFVDTGRLKRWQDARRQLVGNGHTFCNDFIHQLGLCPG